MKPIQCWEGAMGRLHRSAWDAAADIVATAGAHTIKCCTDCPPKDQAVREAILWIADEIRKHKQPRSNRS